MTRDLARRLAALEAIPQPSPRRELTADDWLHLTKLKAATIAYWLGGDAGDHWQRLYAGIASGNASGDRACGLRCSLRRRFDWAADVAAPRAGTGKNGLWEDAFERIPEDDRASLFHAYSEIGELHPDLTAAPASVDRSYLSVLCDGRLTHPTLGDVTGAQLAAFGIEAWIASSPHHESASNA